jgi:CheY-like chemotaxis protein
MKHLILVVEDSDEDFEAFCRVMGEIESDSCVQRACDGEDALDYLYQKGSYQDAKLSPRPSIILLDLNLPGTDGRDVIREIKKNQSLKTIPIVVLTTSSSPKDIETCYEFGANSYLMKPMGLKKLKDAIAIFYQYWLQTSILPSQMN